VEWEQGQSDLVSIHIYNVKSYTGTKICTCRADASIAGEATGAMSWAFINALKKSPQQSYVQLLNSIRSELQGKYDQKPQLSCSHPLGTSCPVNEIYSHANYLVDVNLLYVM
jgi:hypothetical protein